MDWEALAELRGVLKSYHGFGQLWGSQGAIGQLSWNWSDLGGYREATTSLG